MNNQLYVYTTSEHKAMHDMAAEGIKFSNGHKLRWRIKVGWTTQEYVEDRIKQQVNASTSSKIVILGKYDLPVGKNDHHVHQILRDMGFHQSSNDILEDNEFAVGGSEWFDNIWIEDVEQAIDKLIGNASGKKHLTLRNEQKKVIEQIMEAVENGNDERVQFLLGAVCRFGKNVCMLELANRLYDYDPVKFNTVLYTSYKVFMFDSIRSDADAFQEFNRINVINLAEINTAEELQDRICPGCPNVIIASCQSLMD